jgi:chemotaxis protein CheZ
METEASRPAQDALRDRLRQDMTDMFAELRRFVDRRLSEVSAEINATVQLVDFSEANLSGQLGRIHEQIASVLALPAAASRNSGLELQAVIEGSEAAATRIMAAAEAIAAAVPADSALAQHVNAIFEACSFHDLTGQRVRRAVDHLQHVETMLADIMPAGAAPVAADAPAEPPPPVTLEMSQDEIDQLFAAAPPKPA